MTSSASAEVTSFANGDTHVLPAVGSPDEGEALVATNPNLHLVRVPGAGHDAWIDDPQTVVAEIEHFPATEPRREADAAALSTSRSSSPAAKMSPAT